MKLEVGKYYKTRDGRKVGPVLTDGKDFHQIGCAQVWRVDGSVWGEVGDESGEYIVSECTDTPTQEETQDPSLALAEQAKQYGILITFTYGDITITYDGRDQ